MKTKTKVIIAVCLLMLLCGFVSQLVRDSVKLEMVQHGNMEKSDTFDAVVIRDETLINSEKTGVLESLVKDDEMVRRNKHIASVYESEIDDEAKTYLNLVNARIEEIMRAKEEVSSLALGDFRVESAMDSMVLDIRKAIEDGDMEKVAAVHSELNLLNDKKNAIVSGTDYTDSVLNKLREEKAEYEKKLGTRKQDLFSPAAGIYSTSIDGFEEIVTESAIGEMTPYDLESLYKMKSSGEMEKNPQALCKIIDNTEWSVAFLATEKEIGKLKKGSTVYVRTKDSSKDSQGEISYISTPVNGNYVVTVTSDVSCSWAMKERFVTIDLIRNKYKGLKVPVKALRVKDNVTGVYTVVDGIVHFKKVNVLYRDSVYALVEENNAAKDGLLLYDEVIVSGGKNVKEGDRIS